MRNKSELIRTLELRMRVLEAKMNKLRVAESITGPEFIEFRSLGRPFEVSQTEAMADKAYIRFLEELVEAFGDVYDCQQVASHSSVIGRYRRWKRERSTS